MHDTGQLYGVFVQMMTFGMTQVCKSGGDKKKGISMDDLHGTHKRMH